MTPDFTAAIGAMAQLPDWFLWRLTWDAEEGKYMKYPCALSGTKYKIAASDPANRTDYATAVAALAACNARATNEIRYALGFWMTKECGYWFLDIDKCLVDGQWSQLALDLCARFPGAMIEQSSSGNGLHVIGQTEGDIPAHGKKDDTRNIEFYTSGRGIAFGNGVVSGSADSEHDDAIHALIAEFFKPAPPKLPAGKRPEWRGPADDDALIDRMLAAKQSADVAFGGKASLRALWEGTVEHDSHSDMSLACHLAFWTGCDEERMERLMRRSGLYREKWDGHRTYLRELTIARACAQCTKVYQQPEKSTVVAEEMYGPRAPQLPDLVIRGDEAPASDGDAPRVSFAITPEVAEKADVIIASIQACPTMEAMHNEVIPQIHEAQLPAVYNERFVKLINKQLELWDAGLPIAKLRALVAPPAKRAQHAGDAPDWAARHVFLQDKDVFFDTLSGAEKSVVGFNAEFQRNMPMRDNGKRENAAEYCLQRWGIPVVSKKAYRPDQDALFTYAGFEYVNQYNPATIPPMEPIDAATAGAIQEFIDHLYMLCGRRMDYYNLILQWLAHNVQKPGVKIRWAPLFKGVPGDGKTIISTVLREAMGHRHVGVTDNSVLTASGGFTDWALGRAVNFFEEVYVASERRFDIYNSMKTPITNNIINLNKKGKSSGETEVNTCNHGGFTNHNNGLPLDKDDRRWMILFTPFNSIEDAVKAAGMATTDEFIERIGRIADSATAKPGQWRAWFAGIDTTGFNPNGRAPITPERSKMIATVKTGIESLIEMIFEEGGYGIAPTVFSSACFTTQLRMRALSESEDTRSMQSLHHIFARLGWSRLEKTIRWDGKVHRVWLKNGADDDLDTIKAVLDTTIRVKPGL